MQQQQQQQQQRRATTTTTTSLCMDAGGLVERDVAAEDDDDDEPRTNFFDSFLDPAMAAFVHRHSNGGGGRSTTMAITQQTAPWAQLSHSFKLIRKLGNGTFGTAYLCRLNEDVQPTPAYGRVFVIKLPNQSLAADARAHASGALTLGRHVHSVLQLHPLPPQTPYGFGRMHDEAVRDFRGEMHNAERMLEPPCLFRLRAQHAAARKRLAGGRAAIHALVGAALEDLAPGEYFQYLHELSLMHAHVGRHHMHQVLHYSPSVPAIISEHAHGTLESLQIRCMVHARIPWLDAPLRSAEPPPLWTLIAAQLASAMDYMRTHTLLAHTDLKPGNILYRFHGGEPPTPEHEALVDRGAAPYPSIQCLVSDYGICFRKEHRLEPYTPDEPNCFFPGTPLYNPFPQERNEVWAGLRRDAAATTMQSLSYYQFFTTILDMLRFQGASTVPHKTAYFMRWSAVGETVGEGLRLAYQAADRHHVRRLYDTVKRTPDCALYILLHTLLSRDAPSQLESGFDRFYAAIRRDYAETLLDDPMKRDLDEACARAAAAAETYGKYMLTV